MFLLNLPGRPNFFDSRSEVFLCSADRWLINGEDTSRWLWDAWAILPTGLTSATEALLNARDIILLPQDCQVLSVIPDKLARQCERDRYPVVED